MKNPVCDTHVGGNTLPVVRIWYAMTLDAATRVNAPAALRMVNLDDAASFGERSKVGCS
jgi:hypothetical protein